MTQKPRADARIRTADPFITSEVLAEYHRVFVSSLDPYILLNELLPTDPPRTPRDALSLGVVTEKLPRRSHSKEPWPTGYPGGTGSATDQ